MARIASTGMDMQMISGRSQSTNRPPQQSLEVGFVATSLSGALVPKGATALMSMCVAIQHALRACMETNVVRVMGGQVKKDPRLTATRRLSDPR